ncbi:MAG: Gfo/Idh/MocA family oxidoreductase [Deltaproteobacteria bacterium]|nr:Gfo/Idh/MocA family oxidoreductase [Deltaproteobacteria bacterium]
MKQLFQDLRHGKVFTETLPAPKPGGGQLLIRTTVSLISPGTERMLSEFGKAGWFKKALSQPEKVCQVIQKIKTDGLGPTISSVRSKLEEPLPVGYCSAGVVLEVGAGVTAFKEGDRVISNGPHAEVVCVPENLCAKIPEGVDDTAAAFTVISSIALHGIRTLDARVGESVAVIGLGLIGQLACRILNVAGCRVIGFDLDPARVELAERFGARAVCLKDGADAVQAALGFSGNVGVDGVLICASTKSSDPISQAPKMCRKRGKVVLIGVVGLELDRRDFYDKEVSFQVSCSYGPGRYDVNYEQKGLDYPIGYVRWTEQRNFEAVLNMLQKERLSVEDLVSRRVLFSEIEGKYDSLLMERGVLGVVIEYPARAEALERVLWLGPERVAAHEKEAVVGFIGAGAFARSVLVPTFVKQGAKLRAIAGRGAADLASKYDFSYSTTEYEKILSDEAINTVVVATRHNSHADLVVRALEAGKHVWVEKPLAIRAEDVERVGEAWAKRPDLVLMVGFNRRFSPHAVKMKELLKGRVCPLCMVCVVNAGAVPDGSWVKDAEVGGGRIVGEGCHFVDLMRWLAGERIVGVVVSRAGCDAATIGLEFSDGSIGSVHYFSNGHKGVVKERLEVFCEGKVLRVNNWREMEGFGFKGFEKMKLWRQDKGHSGAVRCFLDEVEGKRSGGMSWDEIRDVSLGVLISI